MVAMRARVQQIAPCYCYQLAPAHAGPHTGWQLFIYKKLLPLLWPATRRQI